MRFFERKNFNVISAPLRGYIGSYIPKNGAYRVDEQAKDIIKLVSLMKMSSEEGAELHLVGHDLGSLMVQMAAKMQPALFESVTLIGEPEYKVMLEKGDGSRYSVQNARQWWVYFF